MRLPPCQRCQGWMVQGFGRNETFCANCGHYDYGGPIATPLAALRSATTWESRNQRLSMTQAAPALSRWGMRHRFDL